MAKQALLVDRIGHAMAERAAPLTTNGQREHLGRFLDEFVLARSFFAYQFEF